MRRRFSILTALVIVGFLAGSLGAPAQASEVAKFEAKIAAPGADLAHVTADEFACPKPGDGDGVFYKFIDLKADYTFFKVSGPRPLYTDPTGVLGWGDYDLDLFVYDAKCKEIGKGTTPSGTEKTDTKKPARYAIVHYFYGIHANLPITLQASNASIK